ncbi:E3 ubiquitin-protein ligase UPL4-like isoform X2 [Histomonas meleagridis]|uniref:E3 ubiquitin-protein ligase UPL4-like isoform X2 n=1 Tax=Histomonas meleagridis TaxID=135588 RepID=UPI00355947E3|nr:E3 ubiquitin-protein ligase UPL4-like isoform X2 [Histomonas meleagridis]KAH0803383.1 E3 ubiquitin-protein ligase UPL4-like isoform X2 [Histomonas meleagridis]
MDIGLSYSNDTYDTILALLGADEECQVDGLLLLSDLLIYGNQDLLGGFPTFSVAKQLVEIISKSTNDQVLVLASTCINNFLEAHQASTRCLIENQALQTISAKIRKVNNIEFIQNCILALTTISEYRPIDIATTIGIEPLLYRFKELKPVDQKKIALGIERVSRHSNQFDSSKALIQIVDLFKIQDESIISPIIRSFNNIIQNADNSKIPISIIGDLAKCLDTSTNGSSVLSILDALVTLTRQKDYAEEFLKQNIDYHRLLFTSIFKGNTGEVKRLALNVVVNLLPDINIPDSYWKRNNNKLRGTPKFAVEIQPILIELLLNNSGWETLVLAALAATSIIKPLEPTQQVLNALAGLMRNDLFVTFVLELIMHLKDPSIIVKSGISTLLTSIIPSNDISEWFVSTLTSFLEKYQTSKVVIPFRDKQFNTLHELFEFIGKTEIAPYQFWMSGLMKQTYNFLKGTDKIDSKYITVIDKIIKLSHGILYYLPIPRVPDPIGNIPLSSLASSTVKSTIKAPTETIDDITVELSLDLIALEGWYNVRRNGVTTDIISNTLKNSNLKDIVILNQHEDLTNTQIGALERALNLRQMKRYHYKINNNMYSTDDFFFSSFSRSLKTPNELSNKVNIEIIEGDIPRSKIDVPNTIQEDTLLVLNLFKEIHRLFPNILLHRDRFNFRIINDISSVFLTNGFFTTSSQIVYHYPFLFPFELRKTFFKIIGFNLAFSIPFIDNYFYKTPFNQHNNLSKLKFHIRRNNIFEDGKLLLDTVSCGSLLFDVYFDNEEGIGSGPTQEFFSLFSYELTKKSYKLWRNNSLRNDSNDYYWNEKGLFPSPNADSNLFYFIGLLCAKAITLDMILSIQFNPAFFKLLKGEKVTLEEVDPELKKSLSNADGIIGLDFTYPGYPDVKLKDNGDNIEITKENFDEFVKLVETKTFDSLKDVCDKFINGFNKIIQFDALRIFNGEEICNLIQGEVPRINEKDLENVEVSYGYTKDSKQVKMLFDIILEMSNEEQELFIKFVTGSNRLPVGGLKNLNPKLVIAKRLPAEGQSPDDTLPSVMTCTNYFKIPEYSSKEIMKEKLLIAIKECQGSFLLT